jgi:hypothetical protein
MQALEGAEQFAGVGHIKARTGVAQRTPPGRRVARPRIRCAPGQI